MQASLGHYLVPADIEPVIDELWGDPDTYLYFDHPDFLVYIHFSPTTFEYPSPWVKALKYQSGCLAGDISKQPISSSSLAACIRTDNPVYDYRLVKGEPPLTPEDGGEIHL